MEDYLEWVELPTSTDYVDFLNEHGIAHRTFQDWFFANEDLREVHDYVKERIGVRLQKKLFETNPEMVSKVIRKYHPVWGECWSEEIEAKTKEAEKGASNITVEMKKAADCPDVPPRPEGTD